MEFTPYAIKKFLLLVAVFLLYSDQGIHTEPVWNHTQLQGLKKIKGFFFSFPHPPQESGKKPDPVKKKPQKKWKIDQQLTKKF